MFEYGEDKSHFLKCKNYRLLIFSFHTAKRRRSCFGYISELIGCVAIQAHQPPRDRLTSIDSVVHIFLKYSNIIPI